MARRTVTLVGMSGVGKSHLAKRLADGGYGWHDCDRLIAAGLGALVTPRPGEEPVTALGRWMGMPWTEGYAAREARYLALESTVTGDALRAARDAIGAPQVIDTTGSVIYLDPATLARLCDQTTVVYLRAAPGALKGLLSRYLTEPKPVVWGDAFRPASQERPEDALARCYAALLSFRERRYADLARVTLDVEGGVDPVTAIASLVDDS
jgi:shikimate kinase